MQKEKMQKFDGAISQKFVVNACIKVKIVHLNNFTTLIYDAETAGMRSS